MESQRNRIGYLVPSNNVVLEPEVYAWLPAGVSAHFNRILSTGSGADELRSMAADAVVQMELLAAGKLSVLLYACLSTSVAMGESWDKEYTARISESTGLPCQTAAAATAEAVKGVGANKISLLTPYPADIDRRIPPLFESAGIEVLTHHSLDIEDTLEVGEWAASEIENAAERVLDERAEALAIVATDLDTSGALAAEDRFGVPVITTNLAMLWWALSAMGEAPSPSTPFGLMKAVR